MAKEKTVLISARIDEKVHKDMFRYCQQNGVKLQFFIEEAIRDHVAEKTGVQV